MVESGCERTLCWRSDQDVRVVWVSDGFGD